MFKVKSIDKIIEMAAVKQKKKIAIAGANEAEVKIASACFKLGIADFILIGNKGKIERILKENEIDNDQILIFHEDNPDMTAKHAVRMVVEGKADIPMKGLIHTSTFMKSVLSKDNGLRENRRVSQISVFDGYNGSLQFLTDCAINIRPNLREKIEIINNAVEVAGKFGYKEPLVALLGAAETVNENMPSSMDSSIISQMNRRGQIKGCIIDGPLALDNAISKKAALMKGIDSKVAGMADILVASELETANVMSKTLTYFGKIKSASVICGTTSPVIMTSRTDSMENKINSIAVACYLHTVK